jgi:putative cell wall-binding protein
MKGKNPREGACISAAYDEMMGHFKDGAKSGDIVVVHGWVFSPKLKASIKHAWLEFIKKGIVYEPVNQVILDEKWQKFFKLRPVKRYTYIELIKRSLKTGMKGGVFEF